MREPEIVDPTTPRDVLEAAEEVRVQDQRDLSIALGRILAWLLDTQPGPDRLERLGERVLVVAYQVRPDLIGGATLADISCHRGKGRSFANKLSRSFARTFRFKRHLNAHTVTRRRDPKDLADVARSHGVVSSHLVLVNRFAEWRTLHDEGSGAIPQDAAARLQMQREFEPIARFIAELENRHPVDKPPNA